MAAFIWLVIIIVIIYFSSRRGKTVTKAITKLQPNAAAIAKFGIKANPTMQGVWALLALAANVICISVIIKRSIEQHKNPYTNEIFAGTKDYEEAMARRA